MSPTSDPITVAAASAIFSDDFASGDFTNWTGVTRLTIDNRTGGVAPPSAGAGRRPRPPSPTRTSPARSPRSA